MSEPGGILCSGNIVHDTLVHPVDQMRWGATTRVETLECHIGGNGANTAIALATLGVPVRLLGAVGCDDQARFVLEALRRAGVDTSAVATIGAATAATVALVNSAGDRMFLHRIGVGSEAFAAPIEFAPPLTGGMSHYHLGSIFMLPNLRPVAAATLARARGAGLTTSLDTNWDPQGLWMADLAPCLPQLDFIFVNEDEARMCTGFAEAPDAARVLLGHGARVAVIKLGARGCAIYSAGEEILCPAFEVEARDTTGAGDCFVAGFLAAIRLGKSLAQAGRLGNAVGAFTVQQLGGSAGIPPLAEVEAWAETARVRM